MQTRNCNQPRKAVRREVRTAVCFTRAEYFIVKEKAVASGVKPAAFIRWTALHRQVISRLTEEERQLVRQLVGMANNLNQLARAAGAEGMFTTMRYFEAYRQAFDELLQKLYL